MTVNEMLEKMTAEEILKWISFYRENPFGYDMDNYRTGLVCATVANTTRTKSTDKVYTPEDFMPVKPKEQTVEEMRQSVEYLKSLWSKSE